MISLLFDVLTMNLKYTPVNLKHGLENNLLLVKQLS